MQTDPPLPAGARLLIHASAGTDANDGESPYEAVLHRLRMIVVASARHGRHVPLCLHIEDLQGRRVLAIDDAGPLVDVPLPAGTYHVNAGVGKLRRSYTMTLEPGASFDLYLRLGMGTQRQ